MSSFLAISWLSLTVYSQTTTPLSSTTSSTSTTDAYPILDVADNLYGPAEFTSLDWILSLIILSIVLGVCLFIYCWIKYKTSSSPRSKRQGVAEMVPSSSHNVSGHGHGDGYRPTVAATSSFGSAHEAPKTSIQDRRAFKAALTGVAMAKRESARNIMGSHSLSVF